MAVHVTPEALAVIRNSLELAELDPSETGVRLRVAGGELRPRFASEPREGDEELEVEGVRVFIAPDVAEPGADVEIGVSAEHETLVVRPR